MAISLFSVSIRAVYILSVPTIFSLSPGCLPEVRFAFPRGDGKAVACGGETPPHLTAARTPPLRRAADIAGHNHRIRKNILIFPLDKLPVLPTLRLRSPPFLP
jgi:hypothetical protein